MNKNDFLLLGDKSDMEKFVIKNTFQVINQREGNPILKMVKVLFNPRKKKSS